jgi:hypothetical protein
VTDLHAFDVADVPGSHGAERREQLYVCNEDVLDLGNGIAWAGEVRGFHVSAWRRFDDRSIEARIRARPMDEPVHRLRAETLRSGSTNTPTRSPAQRLRPRKGRPQ